MATINVRPVTSAALVALLALLAGPAGLASAAQQTVTLSTAPSAFPVIDHVVGANTSVVTFNRGTSYWSVPVGGGAPTPTLLAAHATGLGLVGNLTWYADDTGGTHYLDLATNATGFANAMWQAIGPAGGLYITSSGGTASLVSDPIGLTGAHVLTALQRNVGGAIVADTAGAAVVEADGDPATTVIEYYDFGHNTRTTLPVSAMDTADRGRPVCPALTAGVLMCLGAQQVYRIPVNRSPMTVTPANHPVAVAADTASTAWTERGAPAGVNTFSTDTARLFTTPAAGGPATQRTVGGTAVVGGAQDLYAMTGPNLASAGVYSLAGDGAAVRLTTAARAARQTYSLVLGPGRAAWEDSSSIAKPVLTRPVSARATTSPQPPVQVATGANQAPLAVSGTRVAYAEGTDVMIVGGATPVRIHNVAGNVPAQLSGTRLAYLSNGHYYLRNLATGGTVDLTGKYGITVVTSARHQLGLWGNYLAYGKRDGSVWRVNLARPAAPVRLVARGGSTATGLAVFAYGNDVAWSRTFCSPKCVTSSAFRDARTTAPSHLLGSRTVVGAAVSGVLVMPAAPPVSLRRWGSTASVTLPTSHATSSPVPSVYGDVVGWVAADGTPRARSLGIAVVNRPRSLGNPVTTRTLALNATWHLDLPLSAVPTSCSVRITDTKARTVRTVSCTAAARAVGEVVTSWNGTSAGGRRLHGTYRWTVVAGNADGNLLAADGSGAATTGTIVLK